MKAPSGHWGWASIYPNTEEIIHTIAGTATAFSLRLCLHYKAAHAAGVMRFVDKEIEEFGDE